MKPQRGETYRDESGDVETTVAPLGLMNVARHVLQGLTPPGYELIAALRLAGHYGMPAFGERAGTAGSD